MNNKSLALLNKLVEDGFITRVVVTDARPAPDAWLDRIANAHANRTDVLIYVVNDK